MGGIWIKTQNKRSLYFTREIWISEWVCQGNKEYRIYLAREDGEYEKAGAYSSEARAKEVFAEIEKAIISGKPIFEMPEK